MSLEIIVRQEHINTGRRGDPMSCAVAQAVRGAGHIGVLVDFEYVQVWPDEYYVVTDDLHEWLLAFDAHQEVHPERFVLELVESEVPELEPAPATASLELANSPAA